MTTLYPTTELDSMQNRVKEEIDSNIYLGQRICLTDTDKSGENKKENPSKLERLQLLQVPL